MGEEEDKREKEIDKLSELGDAIRNDGRSKSSHIPYDFGLCNKCSKFIYIEYEGYGDFTALCTLSYDSYIKRYPGKKIKVCTSFWDKSHKSVRELAELAHWITTKSKVGF